MTLHKNKLISGFFFWEKKSLNNHIKVNKRNRRLQSKDCIFTCAPHPKPTEHMADGADHDPSDLREITKPVPSL